MKRFRTYQIALSFYKDCKRLRLQNPIKNQFERASLSIVLNLSEGSAKPTRADRRKFYHISLGSLREVQTLLDIISDEALINQANILGGYLYKLCKNT